MTDDRLSVFEDDESGSFDERESRPARRKKRFRERWLLISILSLFLVGLLVVAAVVTYYGKAVVDSLDSVNRDESLNPPSVGRPEPIPVAPGEANAPMNLVLMGSDRQKPDERGRSDVLMVLHIPGDRSNAYLISLPRDYWVEIPGHRTAKINAAYSWGGPALTVQTVEQLLNIPIDHTVLIDFDGFTNVLNAIGGVTVYNEHESTIDGFHFPKGEVTLNGESGLKYVRNRYGLPNGDFDRAERQRNVIKAVVSKLMTRGVLLNPATFRDAVTTLGPQFTVDTAFTNEEIIKLGMSMRITGGESIKTFQAPVAGFGTSSDKQSYVKVDEAKLAKLAAAIRADKVAEYVAGQ